MLLQLPKRPPISSLANVQKISKPINVLTNMFKMQVQAPQSLEIDQQSEQFYANQIVCYQYDVQFQPSIQEDNRNLRYKILKAAYKEIENIIGKFHFTGKSLFVMKILSENTIDRIRDDIPINFEGISYSINMKLIKEFEINEDLAQNKDKTSANYKKGNQVTQVLNVILKDIIRDLGYLEIGKNSKFFKRNNVIDVQVNEANNNTSILEVYKGFTFYVTPSLNKLFLMVDFSTRILRKDTALQFITQNNGQISGESVITHYNNSQIYKIERLDTNKNPKSTFFYKRLNKQITYAEYYKLQYGIQVKNMSQPLLIHIRKFYKPNSNVQQTEEVYLIPELCYMTGMTDQQRNNKQAMQQIARHTKLSPLQRYTNSVQNCRLLTEKANSSGIKIDPSQNVIDAVQLNPPKVFFGQRKSLVPDRGNFDMRAPTFDQVKFQQWDLIYNERDNQLASQFVENLKIACQAYGIQLQDPIYISTNSFNVNDWIKKLDQDFTEYGTPHFVLTFGNIQGGFYSSIKKFLSKDVGIESQHVNPRSLNKNTMSVCSKIALQIASKLGNRIWKVETPTGINSHTMIIGIETSMKKVQNKYVIGVVASVDQDFTKYYSDVEFRNNQDTIILNLTKIIKNSIQAYSINTKNLPQEIIIYRQGLGEGQIQYSLFFEIQSIQNGFQSFKQGYNPRFAFFQVNKKVGQKFYQLNTSNYENDISNPNTGTIVASEVVQNNFEFFMAAQNCNSGVCTPTKYTCLFNNTNLKEDTLWQLTYYQTFNYYNWQGPVRVPAAMKYAEKLAKFTSDTLQESASEDLTNSLYYL